MGIIKLEGETLGQKHKCYNNLIKEVISTNTSNETKKIDYSEPDIDNLFKIDIANKRNDVDYVIEVLKSEDMLYVSRALKRSLWLIIDPNYADIINPDYLHTQLLPQMTSKAGHKLILTIRLNLKDEKRVEIFYKFYENKNDLRTAVKWLPNCSISFIEKVVENHAKDIPIYLIRRLCEKSITILEIYARKIKGYQLGTLLSETMFLLNNEAEKFISIVSSQRNYDIPELNQKSTKKIMKVRPDIIIDNFEKFGPKIDIPTFVKFLKSEDIKDFLVKHLKTNSLQSCLNKQIKHFIFRMPSESRFDFIKRICIEKNQDDSEDMKYYRPDNHAVYNDCILLCASKTMPQSSNANVYKWYKFAPFSVAFTDLKKLIRIESNPNERNEMFAVLIICAKYNSKNVHTILQYYRDKHMNEPFKFKSHFVNIILSQSNPHRYDDETWNILNDILYSMEVYSENENNVQSFLKYIIVYKVVHDTKVPDIIEKKFEFDTLKSFHTKLNDNEKDIVFNYLYQFIITKIKNIKINDESQFIIVVTHVVNVLNLLNDWKKSLSNYAFILEKIREIVEIKENKSWHEDLSKIYNVNKSWRKHMFKESLFLHPAQETCINALKHGPEILKLSKESICLNDALILTRLLAKLRVYWPHSLAKDFEDIYRNRLNDKSKHKAAVRGLCVLLPKKQLTDLLTMYKPQDTKINWTETDDFTLSIQKHLAKYMLLARPHPPVNVILLYAKGDYLQFALPAVHSIFFNLSGEQNVKQIQSIVNAPVSLQKHGLNIAFAKLQMDEILPICLNTWKATKNSTIRTTIFKIIFDVLCKEQNENKIRMIWQILDTFIENLTTDENRRIYITLGNANKVPHVVKQDYCIKSYRYLRSLPPKANCSKFLDSIICSTLDVMESIDSKFIVEVIFDKFDEKFTKQYYNFTNIIAAYLLCTTSETVQTERYENIFVPLLKKYLTFMKDTDSNQFYLKYNFNCVLEQLFRSLEDVTINKNMISPIKLFNDIHNDLEKNFSKEDYYALIMKWKLAAKFVQLIEKYRARDVDKFTVDQSDDDDDGDNLKRNIIYSQAAAEFGNVCMKQLKEEVGKYFSSIYWLFSEALEEIFDLFRFKSTIKLLTLTSIQEHADIVEGHLMVLKLLPDYLSDSKDVEMKTKLIKILDSHPSSEVRMHYQQMVREKERYQ